MTRRAVLTAAAAVAALLPAVPTAPAVAAPCWAQSGAFRTYKYPAFPGETAPVTGGFAVSAFDARRLYVASQKQLLQSTDGGCTWRPVFAVPDSPTAEQPYKYSQMTLRGVRPATSAAAGKRVHLFLQELAGYVRPYIYTSQDGSGGWVAATGLPPAGRVFDVTTAPSDPNVVYATILTGLTYLPTTYASADGGKSFTRVTPPNVAAQTRPFALTVDPANPKRLWATGDSKLWSSPDGGATWAAVPGVTGVSSVTALRGPKTSLLAIAGADAKVWRSDNGGTTWASLVAPAGVAGADFGATARDVFAVSYAEQKSDVWRFDARTKRFVRAAAKTPFPAMFGFEREHGKRPAFWSYAASTGLVRWAP